MTSHSSEVDWSGTGIFATGKGGCIGGQRASYWGERPCSTQNSAFQQKVMTRGLQEEHLGLLQPPSFAKAVPSFPNGRDGAGCWVPAADDLKQ